MADVTSLEGLLNAYGVAVRAGAITPQIEDEEYFRVLFELPPISTGVRNDWAASNGIRKPITLTQQGEPKPKFQSTEENSDDKEQTD